MKSLMSPVAWHSHEMVFGFGGAVVSGFVLTAIQNWSGKRGVHGLKLMLLVALWMSARILLLMPGDFCRVGVVADLLYFPMLAVFLIPYLKDPELKIERVFILYCVSFLMANLLMHLDTLGWVPGHSRQGVILALNTLLAMIVFMGGRVIPFFTESSVARSQPKTYRVVEILSHLSVWLFIIVSLVSEPLALPAWINAYVAWGAALVHALRLKGWFVRRLYRIPILWILHLGYLWIVIGFVMRGLSDFGWIEASAATHAFTVGCVSTLIYGMITRVSLGHTGRPLKPVRAVVFGYVLMGLAAVIRTLPPLILRESYWTAIWLSGSLWLISFVILLWVYSPMWTRPRVDGRPGLK